MKGEKYFPENSLIIGAGLIGTYTVKEMNKRGYNVYATILDEREIPPFEKRTGFPVGGYSKKGYSKNIGPFHFRNYKAKNKGFYNAKNKVFLGKFDIFKKYEGKTAFRSLIEGFSENEIEIGSIINSINLGTIFGLKAFGGELGTRDIFNFCYDINNSLAELAKRQNNKIKYLTVGTTGNGGIGLENLKISHDIDNIDDRDQIPPTIIEKTRCANEVLNFFKDFRQSSSLIDYKGIVPASAVVDTTVFKGPVPLYGYYKKLYENCTGNLPLISAAGKREGDINARYFIFGEDGPHTFYDAQQLQMFMGFTSADKIAEIIADEIEGIGSTNYNVLIGGSTIPAQSDYLIKAMEKKGKQNQIPTLSPIGPFDISLLSFTFDLLSKNGYETLSSLENLGIEAAERKIGNYLISNDDYTKHAISLGVEFDLNNERIKRTISRGIISRATIVKAKKIASEFKSFMEESERFSEFMDLFRNGEIIYIKDINGYLAAFPFAKTMRKRGHF